MRPSPSVGRGQVCNCYIFNSFLRLLNKRNRGISSKLPVCAAARRHSPTCCAAAVVATPAQRICTEPDTFTMTWAFPASTGTGASESDPILASMAIMRGRGPGIDSLLFTATSRRL